MSRLKDWLMWLADDQELTFDQMWKKLDLVGSPEDYEFIAGGNNLKELREKIKNLLKENNVRDS